MSEYADIKIGNLSLFSFRNYLDPAIVSLFFSSKDLVINQCLRKDSENAEGSTQYIYKTTVKCARERLDACGFTLSALERLFNKSTVQAIDYSPYLLHSHIDLAALEEVAKKRAEKYVTFRKWKNATQKLVNQELKNGNIQYYSGDFAFAINTECDKIIYYALKADCSESFYGLKSDVIPCAYVIRLVLDNCDDDCKIVLDFSNLQYWDDDCIDKALLATNDIEKTIVLVEGTSDKDILGFAMTNLYPHLSDLFYFMDFEDTKGGKRDGGTSFVIKNLKTFYFSKIKANFIAIFDNDAEGYDSRCALIREIKDWPNNFRILLYPDLQFFHKYPTISPNGKIIEDNIINKACSIELYLPDSIIKDGASYYPIEWESRKIVRKENGETEALYQGVISQKDNLKKKFHDLRKKIEKGEETFVLEDWSRMKKLLETIVFAFK